jgi:hypothetical protein
LTGEKAALKRSIQVSVNSRPDLRLNGVSGYVGLKDRD